MAFHQPRRRGMRTVSAERVWIPYACSALTVLGDSHWSMLSLIWGFGAGSVGKSRIARSTAPARPCRSSGRAGTRRPDPAGGGCWRKR
uniref:Uncharacterized protein n=1 Tax=Klebsiella pneumoniae TaxID=573 RepID=A0A2P1BPR2_KLEPN|nr:hypothetical protein [Klebsiella pneumoniae]